MAQDVRLKTHSKEENKLTETNSQSIENWLQIQLIPQFGPAKLASIVENSSIEVAEILKLGSAHLKQLGFNEAQINAIRRPDRRKVDAQLAWLSNDKSRFAVHLEDNNYPKLLKQIASPPMVLFGYGNQALINDSQIAIVGSRNPTHSGKRMCFELASEVAAGGVCVTSGLAIGIDAYAHTGALSVRGKTLAVLGSGLNHIYPKRNLSLAHDIVSQGGVLLSEFFVDTKPKAEHFPRRNRIVSGLSLGVLVVEAAVRSGSLITARYALEQNREVMAVPGSPLNPLSAGCHFLIKQGAKLVESSNDILEEFQNVSSFVASKDTINLQKSQSQSLATVELLDSVDYDVTALDVIIQRSNLPIKEVLAQLLQYELRGLVATVSGGYIKLRGK